HSLGVHQPFIWSIDVHQTIQRNVAIEQHQKTILHYAISGDGKYAVTLSATKKIFFIDLWDNLPTQSEIQTQQSPFSPKNCAGVHIPLPGGCILNSSQALFFMVSISFDGSMIALIDGRNAQPSEAGKALSALYLYYMESVALYPSDDFKKCRGLENFYGYGKFHFATPEKKVGEELFVAYNGNCFNIYYVTDKWQHIRTIEFGQPRESILPYDWDNRLQGPYFVWANHTSGIISTQNIQSGSIVLYLPPRTEHHRPIGNATYTFSSDYMMIAVVLFNSIAVYRASSGTMIASRMWDYNGKRFCDPLFINEGRQVMIRSSGQEECFTLNVSDLSFEATFLLPQMSTAASFQEGSGQTLYTFFGSNLDLFRLEDYRVREDWEMKPWSVDARPSCDETCKKGLSPISNPKEIYSSSFQLFFRVALEPGSITNIFGGVDQGHPSVVLSIYNTNQILLQTLTIPSYKDSHNHSTTSTHYTDAVLLVNPPRLAVVSKRLLMIWKLPENPGTDLSLDLAWGFPDEGKRKWKSCIHHELYFLLDDKEIPQHVDPVFSSFSAEYVLQGVMGLIKIHQVADTDICNAIIQYSGSIINNHPGTKDHVLYNICNTWSEDSSNSIERFVEALFVSEHSRWLPSTDVEQHKIFSPLRTILKKAKKIPSAMGLAEIIINYCFCQTEKEQDRRFLIPVIQCLRVLLKREKSHSDLGLRVLRRLAFIPMDKSERSFILEHYRMSHRPFLRWRLWESNTSKLLYNCKDPILQLSSNSSDHNSEEHPFTKELFVAPFSLLWSRKKNAPPETAKNSPSITSPSITSPSITSPSITSPSITSPSKLSPWISIPLYIYWHKLKIKPQSNIKRHRFVLDELDNPATVALLKYKWDTIGFKYLVVRYMVKYIYVSLITFTLLLQVYASIDQLFAIWDNTSGISYPGIMSFAWVLLNLSILCDLRASQNVCRFVTIVVEVFSQLSCPETTAEKGGKEFPINLFKAGMTTLFFAGGRYDPVESLLESDNYAFLILISFKFVGTTIIMVNILI
ncbi:hypothetical protein BGX27_002220, partial [Mortierella sp. AM989]